jgi:NADP-dependent 3-hydroxy acid dehydrogenase YdfG
MNKKTINYINNNLHDLDNKKVVVTGSTSGIGLALCEVLLMKNAHIVLAARNENKVKQTKEYLLKQFNNAQIDILLYEQNSYEGMDKLLNSLTNEHSDFYALVLNAGIFKPNKKDRFENIYPSTIGVNYLANFYFLEKLRDILKTSEEEKRIIVQGSLASRMGKCQKFEQLINTKNGLMKQYILSKFAIHNYLRHLAKTNNNPKIKYMICEPGITNSNIIRNFPKWFKNIARVFLSLFCHSTGQSTLSAAYLVCNYCANGNHFVPNGLLTQSGLPKPFNDKRIVNYTLIEESKEKYGK